MPACSSSTRAVAKVLNESGVVPLHPRCGRCVAPTHCSIDNIEATQSFVQPQLEIRAAAPREVLRPPFNVEDAVGSSATYRCEYAKPTVNQIQVVPVRVDREVVGEPRQALVGKGGIRGHELGIAVGRQIDAGESRAVQAIRERQRDGGDRIIPMIADVRCAWDDTAPYLSDRVVAHARGRGRRRRWSGRGCRCRSRSGRSRWRR